jgi:hypothetical protein
MGARHAADRVTESKPDRQICIAQFDVVLENCNRQSVAVVTSPSWV